MFDFMMFRVLFDAYVTSYFVISLLFDLYDLSLVKPLKCYKVILDICNKRLSSKVDISK